MKITALDGYTLDLNKSIWERFNDLGEFNYFDDSSEDQVIERTINSNVILVNKVNINEAVINKSKDLKLIVATATGYNNIDAEYAKKKGILVCNVPAYGTDSVMQMTFAHILNFACQFNLHVNNDYNIINIIDIL